MTNQAVAEIKDERLTRANFARALKELGPIDSASRAELLVSDFLVLQAGYILNGFGLSKIIKVEVAERKDMPPGYDKDLDITAYFPWRLTVGERSLDFSGRYDFVAVHGKPDFAPGEQT